LIRFLLPPASDKFGFDKESLMALLDNTR